jgi:magnesium chelatase family protein
VALVGGGSVPRPGEISLAHAGVLFLDELPEFSRRVLETLRQPLEQGSVHIARAARSVSFPARVTLVAAMNPCPCGFFGSDARRCVCPPGAVARYGRRLSGPLRDRFDLSVEVSPVPWADLRSGLTTEATATVRARVVEARDRQQRRQGCPNARLEARSLDRVTACGPAAEEVLQAGVQKLGLSARGVTRVLRVARTIADLAGSPVVEPSHLTESMQFRARAGDGA